MPKPIAATGIETRIVILRGQKVLLDADLAELYGVKTHALNQAVRRNIERFPADFMFGLTGPETAILRSQIVISRSGWGGRRTKPLAFTEHGVAMLASVLRSSKAIQVNIAIVRAFVRLREFLATHQQLAKKLAKLERRYDEQFLEVFDAIHLLMRTEEKQRSRKMGFVRED